MVHIFLRISLQEDELKDVGAQTQYTVSLKPEDVIYLRFD